MNTVAFIQVFDYKEAFENEVLKKQYQLVTSTKLKPESYYSTLPSGDIISDQEFDIYLCEKLFEEEFDFTVVENSSIGMSSRKSNSRTPTPHYFGIPSRKQFQHDFVHQNSTLLESDLPQSQSQNHKFKKMASLTLGDNCVKPIREEQAAFEDEINLPSQDPSNRWIGMFDSFTGDKHFETLSPTESISKLHQDQPPSPDVDTPRAEFLRRGSESPQRQPTAGMIDFEKKPSIIHEEVEPLCSVRSVNSGLIRLNSGLKRNNSASAKSDLKGQNEQKPLSESPISKQVIQSESVPLDPVEQSQPRLSQSKSQVQAPKAVPVVSEVSSPSPGAEAISPKTNDISSGIVQIPASIGFQQSNAISPLHSPTGGPKETENSPKANAQIQAESSSQGEFERSLNKDKDRESQKTLRKKVGTAADDEYSSNAARASKTLQATSLSSAWQQPPRASETASKSLPHTINTPTQSANPFQFRSDPIQHERTIPHNKLTTAAKIAESPSILQSRSPLQPDSRSRALSVHKPSNDSVGEQPGKSVPKQPKNSRLKELREIDRLPTEHLGQKQPGGMIPLQFIGVRSSFVCTPGVLGDHLLRTPKTLPVAFWFISDIQDP